MFCQWLDLHLMLQTSSSNLLWAENGGARSEHLAESGSDQGAN